MKTLRQVGHFKLNEGNMQANGLYNLTNDILLAYTSDEGCSDWFDGERKDELMALNDSDFLKEAKKDAGNDIYSKQVYLSLWKDITDNIMGGKLIRKYRTGLGRTFYEGETMEEIQEWLNLTFKRSNK